MIEDQQLLKIEDSSQDLEPEPKIEEGSVPTGNLDINKDVVKKVMTADETKRSYIRIEARHSQHLKTSERKMRKKDMQAPAMSVEAVKPFSFNQVFDMNETGDNRSLLFTPQSNH